MVGSTGGWVGIQDSKQYAEGAHRTTLATPPLQWSTFLDAIKTSQIHC